MKGFFPLARNLMLQKHGNFLNVHLNYTSSETFRISLMHRERIRHRMKMEKRKFRIGELSSVLGVEQFVVRFWEKEFVIKSTRSAGGQRFYDEDDLKRFQIIKSLLYEQGFTIAGARKQLKARNTQPMGAIIASQKTSLDSSLDKSTRDEKNSTSSSVHEESERVAQQIATLQKKLVQLRELL